MIDDKWLPTKEEMLLAEIEVLRGKGCEEDGDGPCGACLKCNYNRGRLAGLEEAAWLVLRFLSYDSQREVSWHEVNYCAESIRALASRPASLVLVERAELVRIRRKARDCSTESEAYMVYDDAFDAILEEPT